MQTDSLIGTAERSPAMHLAGLALAQLGIAAATVAGQLIVVRWGTGPVVLLYLLPVLGAAIYSGLWSSLVAAVVATLAYNFFFTEPVHTLLISSPASAVTVAILFLVGVVTSSLAGSLREHALVARTHAARNATIAGFARRLLSCVDEAAILQVSVEEIAGLFDCRAVALAGEDHLRIVASMPAEHDLSPADIAMAAQAIASGKPAGRGIMRGPNLGDWQFHSARVAESPGVAIGLAREDGAPAAAGHQIQLLDNLLDQAALALSRARAEAESRQLAGLRERDTMRDALLSSMGRDIKPSLNAITAAGRALKRAGAGDRTDIATISDEAVRLNRYIDNLAEVVPDIAVKPVTIGDVTIDLYRRTVSRDDQAVHLSPKEFAVLAELAKHAGRVLSHAHLLRAVWGPAQQDQVEYLRVAIGALRRKLEANPGDPVMILNEPSVGYRLAAP